MSTRVSLDVSQLPANARIDTYEDGTVWLRCPGGPDEYLRQYAQRVGVGPGRTEDIDLTVPTGTKACETCGADVPASSVRDAAFITWGKILCPEDTPHLERRPDTGERRRKSDTLTSDPGPGTQNA